MKNCSSCKLNVLDSAQRGEYRFHYKGQADGQRTKHPGSPGEIPLPSPHPDSPLYIQQHQLQQEKQEDG